MTLAFAEQWNAILWDAADRVLDMAALRGLQDAGKNLSWP